jgi:hypothetical protein
VSNQYEFRVIGVEAAFNRPYINENPASLGEAEMMAEYFRAEGDHNVRIERRKVGSWDDIQGTES